MAHYYSMPGGGVADNNDGLPLPLPAGWTEITLAAYNAQLAILNANIAADIAAEVLADCLVRKAVYDDIVDGGPNYTKMFAATGVTAGTGDVTFNMTAAGFAATPVVQVSVQAADSASPLDYRITALSATSVTIRVRSSPATVIALLGLTLLGASVPQNGVTVHLTAFAPGSSSGGLGLTDTTAHALSGWAHGSC